MGRKLRMHLYGCYIEITMRTAEENSVLGYAAAVNMLVRPPHTDEAQARAAVDELIAAEVIRREGDILTVVDFGTSIVPTMTIGKRMTQTDETAPSSSRDCLQPVAAPEGHERTVSRVLVGFSCCQFSQ